MNSLVIQFILQFGPAIITILTVIALVAKTVHQLTSVKKEVVDMKDMHEVKAQMSQLLQENYALKKQLNELLTKIDRVARK